MQPKNRLQQRCDFLVKKSSYNTFIVSQKALFKDTIEKLNIPAAKTQR
jgi:hypothetical protein